MTDEKETTDAECAAAREELHHAFDGDGPGAGAPDHLDGCSACRDWASDLAELRRAMSALPQPAFPDEALQEVWSRTVDRPGRPLGRPAWAWAVAAALLLAAVGLGLWGFLAPESAQEQPTVAASTAEPTEEEIRKAAEEVRMVLALTSRAVRRSERVAMRRILAGQVAPALDRTVVDWPSVTPADKGRNGA